MTTSPNYKIEVFCGTGGVGKTTLATSRAIYLANSGKKVLLITIDPSKRLKEVLNLDNENALEAQKVSLDKFLGEESKDKFLYAQLMSPLAPLKRMSEKSNGELLKNPVVKILSRPYGGMNEIMAILELHYQNETKLYDTIILDTPPGQHFIDFLNAGNKIRSFFDSNFGEIFKFLGKKISHTPSNLPGQKLLGMIASSGIKKLLSYLDKVTGKTFVEQFVDAIAVLFKHRNEFLEGINFLGHIEDKEFSHWYLVTSTEQQKIVEAKSLIHAAQDIIHHNSTLLINKCLFKNLERWNTDENEKIELLKKSLIQREEKLNQFAKNNFEHYIQFPEVFKNSPTEHIKSLFSSWN